MKGLPRLLLLLGFGAIGLFFLRGVPRDVTIVYDIADPAHVRALEVDVMRGGSPLRHAEYRFPDGAPRQVRHPVRLPDGEYEVRLRVSRGPGDPERTRLPLVVDDSGAVVLFVGDAAPRPD
ncbi:MAG TPA: hypothetical protein PLL32_00310 [Anaeromyxobacteraceae bacterium]|nr:hypothetical protein [Anaeromyxobacteraceae bacterium]